MKDLSIMVGDAIFNYRVGLIIKKGDEMMVEANPEYEFVVIPGGRVKTLESSIDALIREIKEEMNVEIKKEEIKIKSLIENFFMFEGNKVHEMFITYEMEIKEDDERFKGEMKNIDSKANYYKWVKLNDIESVKILPVILKDAIKSKEFKHLILMDL